MKVYALTHTEHGWNNILSIFLTKEGADQYVDWYSNYCETQKDVLIILTSDLHQEFNKERFE